MSWASHSCTPKRGGGLSTGPAPPGEQQQVACWPALARCPPHHKAVAAAQGDAHAHAEVEHEGHAARLGQRPGWERGEWGGSVRYMGGARCSASASRHRYGAVQRRAGSGWGKLAWLTLKWLGQAGHPSATPRRATSKRCSAGKSTRHAIWGGHCTAAARHRHHRLLSHSHAPLTPCKAAPCPASACHSARRGAPRGRERRRREPQAATRSSCCRDRKGTKSKAEKSEVEGARASTYGHHLPAWQVFCCQYRQANPDLKQLPSSLQHAMEEKDGEDGSCGRQSCVAVSTALQAGAAAGGGTASAWV